jgi:hypothetical protein
VDTDTIKLIIDVGMSGMLLWMLTKVWERLNTVTDQLLDLLAEARLQRVKLLQDVEALKVSGESKGGS